MCPSLKPAEKSKQSEKMSGKKKLIKVLQKYC